VTNFPTLWFHRTFTPSAHADLHGIEADDSRGLYWTSSAVLGHCSSGHLHVTQLHLNNKNVMLVGWLVVLHETLWNPKTSDILHLPEFWTIKSIFAHRSQIYQELSMSSLLEGQYFFGGDKILWNLSQGSGNLRYLIGIVAVTIFADDGGAEFSSVSAAMFTAFRCFTDGCAATDGTPLQELLLQSGTLLDY